MVADQQVIMVAIEMEKREFESIWEQKQLKLVINEMQGMRMEEKPRVNLITHIDAGADNRAIHQKWAYYNRKFGGEKFRFGYVEFKASIYRMGHIWREIK